MATRQPIPHPNVPVIDVRTGLMTVDWYSFFQDRTRTALADLPDVSTTAPTNGQVLIWNSTSKLWVPGAN